MKLHIRYIFLIILLSCTCIGNAQNVRDYIRQGNRLFHQRQFVKAEISYRKAIEKDHQSTEAQFNLGNALMMQGKVKKAIPQFQKAAQTTDIKVKKAKPFHNIGEIYQMTQQYQQAINAYKQALRYNPHDDQTRYNLALCQKLLKQQPPQDNKNNKNKNKKNDKNKNKDKNKQNKDQNKNQNKNNNQNKNQQNKQQQPKDQMSKENAEQMLNAALDDERNAQQKNRKVQTGNRKLEKNW